VLLEFCARAPAAVIDRIWNAHVLPLIGRVVSGDATPTATCPNRSAASARPPSWRRC
jgi:hypothetical protein